MEEIEKRVILSVAKNLLDAASKMREYGSHGSWEEMTFEQNAAVLKALVGENSDKLEQ